jgi:hypothetical protein
MTATERTDAKFLLQVFMAEQEAYDTAMRAKSSIASSALPSVILTGSGSGIASTDRRQLR